MYILITNDDGPVPGLFALKRSLQSIADIVVVAPGSKLERGRAHQDFAQTAARMDDRAAIRIIRIRDRWRADGRVALVMLSCA
jgi:broad specificity polyphosphatase/5'/3'-nucleotidase SurE